MVEKSNEFRLSARLWDVDREKCLASLSGLPDMPNGEGRPGVAVWHTGPRANQVGAAFALYDLALRTWNAPYDQKGLQTSSTLKERMSTVAVLPGETKCLTAVFGSGSARLRAWTTEDGKPKPADLPATGPADSFPQALGLLSSKAAGPVDLAAAVVLRLEKSTPSLPLRNSFSKQQRPTNRRAFALQILDLDGKKQGNDEVLWSSPRQPVLATSPRGRHVAVAGSPDHAIRVYALASLLGKNKGKYQKLGSLGKTFEDVSFVRQGDDLGLRLHAVKQRGLGEPAAQSDPTKNDGTKVFAFRQRGWSTRLDKWQTAAPPAGNWKAKHGGRRRRRVAPTDRKSRRSPCPPGMNCPITPCSRPRKAAPSRRRCATSRCWRWPRTSWASPDSSCTTRRPARCCVTSSATPIA